jgi:hypothetical protein
VWIEASVDNSSCKMVHELFSARTHRSHGEDAGVGLNQVDLPQSWRRKAVVEASPTNTMVSFFFSPPPLLHEIQKHPRGRAPRGDEVAMATWIWRKGRGGSGEANHSRRQR